MPFGTIASQTLSYNPRNNGRYVLSTLGFGDPANEFIIRPCLAPSRDGKLRASIGRLVEKDITVGGVTTRMPLAAVLAFTTPRSGFTATEMDSLATDLSNFVTADTITRVFAGEA